MFIFFSCCCCCCCCCRFASMVHIQITLRCFSLLSIFRKHLFFLSSINVGDLACGSLVVSVVNVTLRSVQCCFYSRIPRFELYVCRKHLFFPPINLSVASNIWYHCWRRWWWWWCCYCWCNCKRNISEYVVCMHNGIIYV